MTATEAPPTEATAVEATTLEAAAPAMTMQEQEQQLGKTALAAYLAAGVAKKAARASINEWDAFFAERGVDPQKQIDRLVAAANPAAGGSEQVAVVGQPQAKPVAANTVAMDGPEAKFVLKYAGEHKTEGFTLDEIVKAAVAEKVIAEETKESRQPFYKIVLNMKNAGTLVDAPFQRDTKTVFILPA